MKNFLRISIVILILIGLGFATYAMFFKPANKDEVYLALSNVDKIEQELKLDAGLQGVDTSRLNAGVNYTYPQIKECMDEVFNYYYAYSQAVSKTIPLNTLKNIKSSVKDYENSLSNLIVNGFDEVKSLQDYMSDNPDIDVSDELKNRYKKVVLLYRDYLETYADLINKTKDFVVEYVFDGEMITDRESLLYDLMIDSLKKALSGEYDNESLKEISDDYMKSAINFTNLAMKSDFEKNEALSRIYRYEGKTVEYGGKLYMSQVLEYYLMSNLQFRVEKVGNYGTLYLGNSDIVVVDANSHIVEVDDVGYVSINVTHGYSTSKISQQSVAGMVTFNCYVDANNLNKLYFYDGDYSHLEENRKWINLAQSLELSGSQVVFTDASGQKSSVTYVIEKKYYYEISIQGNSSSINYYKVDDKGEVLLVGTGVKLQGANYHENNFYSSTILKDLSGELAGEVLNYKTMIKCYNKIMKNSTDEVNKMINLTYEQKIAFVEDLEINGSRVRAEFVEVLHEEMEYLLACCGFLEEVK